MPIFSAVWSLREQGVAVKGDRWQIVIPSNANMGLFMGRYGSGNGSVTIDFVDIASGGNATDFGDISTHGGEAAACSSTTKAFLGGGYDGGSPGTGAGYVNYIQTSTYSTLGNTSDYGDLTVARYALNACSSTTRGVWAGGAASSSTNVIDYVSLSSAGNAIDFGDLGQTYRQNFGATSNTTRGCFGGGLYTSASNVIDYITIGSTGNVTDFGDLASATSYLGVGIAASSTRGLFMGGNASSSSINVIQYITIGSTGNATDFGDLVSPIERTATTSNATKAVSGGGYDSTNTDTTAGSATYGIKVDVVTIASTGNATDFGDLTERGRAGTAACGGQGGLTA